MSTGIITSKLKSLLEVYIISRPIRESQFQIPMDCDGRFVRWGNTDTVPVALLETCWQSNELENKN